MRRFIADYGMPIAVVACSALAYWGRFHESINVDDARLPISGAFSPAGGRDWLVPFWQLPGRWVGIAFPFGFVLFVVRPAPLPFAVRSSRGTHLTWRSPLSFPPAVRL